MVPAIQQDMCIAVIRITNISFSTERHDGKEYHISAILLLAVESSEACEELLIFKQAYVI